ncbi:PE family protein [Mycobacterium ostraviense]|uniref:PE family protein n=1 Tax=Mycobacterium ostraviense TaxID=2738409 RepID=UPI001E50E065|nr:PE family protein [Mycobacterium ostraviense]UGT90867.1 PE family protein [Mycobacterium ostraviense]
MSFVIAAPDPLLAAAGDLIGIGSAISLANASATAPTTNLSCWPPPGMTCRRRSPRGDSLWA